MGRRVTSVFAVPLVQPDVSAPFLGAPELDAHNTFRR
ncbi:hypothetical protein BH11GEM1_BH11GEM1_15770 [soil metagenome]